MAEENPAAPAADYDQFVDWDKRLAREAPLFKWAFRTADVHSVVDVGAGSGMHAIMFAEWGLSVDAVDPADSMLARAEANIETARPRFHDKGGRVRLLKGGFGELAGLDLDYPADALVCTGNALPHVEGREGLRVTLADFARVVRPDGVLVLHLLNHERLMRSRVRAIPPVLRDTPEGVKVFLRVIGYPPGDEYLDFDFLTLVRDADGEWELSRRCSMHAALPADMLAQEVEAAGFDRVELFGDHERSGFDIERDESVILVARRRVD